MMLNYVSGFCGSHSSLTKVQPLENSPRSCLRLCSFKAHSSVEKAGLISLVKMKFLPVDEHFSLRGKTLRRAIEEDRKRGLVPVFVSLFSCSWGLASGWW